jgi:hypothetical protein
MSVTAQEARLLNQLLRGRASKPDPLAGLALAFQQVRPHPEEAAKWPSRRMGRNTDL